MKRLITLSLGILVALAGCGEDPVGPSGDPVPAEPFRLLSLGDSYTVGHAVSADLSWPRQLADSLAAGGDTLDSLEVVAVTGWTTRDLLDALRADPPAGSAEPYSLVTLMIGVNNQFQGLSPVAFAADMDTLMALALELAGDAPAKVLGFSIPDYGVTPVGQLFDPEAIAQGVETFNGILADRYASVGIPLHDVTTLSRLAAEDPALVARDGLHLSGTMYALWVSDMLPAVSAILGVEGQKKGPPAGSP